MSAFKVVLIEHGYPSLARERSAIEAAGGTMVDAESLSLADALGECETAQAILCRRLKITADLIARFRRCRGIVRYGVGTDNVDVDAATAAGIIVGHVPSYGTDDVSTHAVSLLLAVIRRIVSTQRKIELGGWEMNRKEAIHRTAGRALGIIGLGQIGQAVARKMQTWNMPLLACDPFAPADRAARLGIDLVSLDELLARSDYISLHCPLLPETRHLISASALSATKSGAILVNTARGALVDETALLAALDNGRLAGAGLDVFEQEPLPVDSPFRFHPKLIVSDHTAWYSEESQGQLQDTVAQTAVCIGQNQLPGSMANPEVLVKLGRWQEWKPAENMLWQLARLRKLGRPLGD